MHEVRLVIDWRCQGLVQRHWSSRTFLLNVTIIAFVMAAGIGCGMAFGALGSLALDELRSSRPALTTELDDGVLVVLSLSWDEVDGCWVENPGCE